MYYAIIIFSTVLFSLSFFMNKGYQKLNGSSFEVSLKYALQSGAVSFCIMMILSNFKLEFSWFSLGMALLNSSISVTLSYCGNRSLKTANLSVYSVFMMLGGMVLPSLYGILFFHEAFTIGKFVCCVLIIISLVFSIESKGGNRKAYKFYVACFFLNGLAAVVAKMHQSGNTAVGSQSFIAMSNILTVSFCFFYLFLSNKKMLQIRRKDLQFTAGGACFNGIANLLLLIALKHVEASVQYPLVTGGVIVFSALVTRISEKKITRKNILAVIFAFLAAIFVIV